MLFENEKQDKLLKLIKTWANGKKSLENNYRLNSHIKTICEIYSDDFRHFYSSIFNTLTHIDMSDKLDLDILAQNINHIYSKLKEHNNEEVRKKFKKLYDHVNLDIARIQYMRNIDEKGEQNRQEVIAKISTINTDIRIAQSKSIVAIKKAKNALSKAKSMQKDYITILGIFASIVITFAFSATFSTSILANIHQVNIVTLVLVIAVLGGLLINILGFLYNFILTLNDKEKISLKQINKKIAWVCLCLFIAVLFLSGTFDDLFYLF